MTLSIVNIVKITSIFVLIFATFQAQGQKMVHIVSSTVIDAKVEEVYNLIKDYKRFPEWSPFLVSDPAQKNHVTGENGAIGSVFHWEGVGEKSLGNQELTELKQNEYAKMYCTVQKPFKANSTFEYVITETDNGVEVKQIFKTEMGRFSYFMANLFGMQKEITKTNQLGLDRLKAVLEGTELVGR